MSTNTEASISTVHLVNLLDPELAARIQQFQIRRGVLQAGYDELTDWHPMVPEQWGRFPDGGMQRSLVYRGNASTWAYSLHPGMAKFGDRYVVAWSNGLRHEDYPGQEVHFSHGTDGRNWSPPEVVAATDPDSGLVRFCSGMHADSERVCCYVGVAKDFGRDKVSPGLSMLKEDHIHLDVYETSDLVHWTPYERICDRVILYEGPRLTRGGRLLCCGFDCYDRIGLVLIWDDPTRPTDPPRVVNVPASSEGVSPLEGTWYQTDDGRIWMFCRDANLWGGLGVFWSDDEGDTWSDLWRTDFPNSSSLAWAGRLSDGRYAILGNNYNRFLDRSALLMALSDDGELFNRQYMLVDEPTTRRVNGRHKENGYHYPDCVVDGDKLLVVYGVNKEDIEVGTIDLSAIR